MMQRFHQMATQGDRIELAKEKLSAARACLQRYVRVTGGNQCSDLYDRFVRDVRGAAREYVALEDPPPGEHSADLPRAR